MYYNVDFFSVFTNWEAANKYKILNSVGQQVFYAAEGKFLSNVCAFV